MGMSASQARFLSLTARMHDLEHQAQAIDNAKLSLTHDSNIAYEEYCDEINASKFQIAVKVPGAETKQVDMTFANIIASGSIPNHTMYMLVNRETDEIYLPEQVTKNFVNGNIPDTLDEFLKIVATKYVYSGSLMGDSEAVAKLNDDGYKNYWTSIYYHLAGFTDNQGNANKSHGFISVSNNNANDRGWIKKQIVEANAILNRMEAEQVKAGAQQVNVFTETNVPTDQNLSETGDELRVKRAEATYENRLKNINQKDKQFDLRLSKIESEHNALKTEYDTVKDLVKKNIERSYKTFNA